MSRTTRLVYIAHPLGAGPDRSENIERAARWFAWAARADGVIPCGVWLILARFDAETQENRERNMLIDKRLIARCDEVWLCGPRVSPGMQQEAEHARACGVSVVNFTLDGLVEPPPDDDHTPPSPF